MYPKLNVYVQQSKLCHSPRYSYSTSEGVRELQFAFVLCLTIKPFEIYSKLKSKTPLLHLINFILEMHILFPNVPNPYPAVCPGALPEDFTSNPHLVHQSIKISPNNICLFSKMYLFSNILWCIQKQGHSAIINTAIFILGSLRKSPLRCFRNGRSDELIVLLTRHFLNWVKVC